MSTASTLTTGPPPTVVAAMAGATGQLGGHVATALKRAGFSVVAFVRPESATSPAARRLAGVATVVALPDLTDVDAVAAALSRARASVLISTVAGRGNASASPAALRNAEVDIPLALYAACVKAGCITRYVVGACPPLRAFARSGVTRFKSPYLSAKHDMVTALRAAERRANAAPPITIVQVAAWCRDAEPLVASLRASRVAPLVSGGVSRLQPIADPDLAARIVAGLATDADAGATLCVGGPRVLTFRALWEAAGAAAGVQPRFVPLPRAVLDGVLLPVLRVSNPRLYFMLALASDVAHADLVGEETVGAVTVADWLRLKVQPRL